MNHKCHLHYPYTKTLLVCTNFQDCRDYFVALYAALMIFTYLVFSFRGSSVNNYVIAIACGYSTVNPAAMHVNLQC